MEAIKFLFDFVVHIDDHLGEIIKNFGVYTNLILFLIVFLETGLVVTPFLPGDSLLFAAGALAALHSDQLNVVALFFLLAAAAITGDTINYWLGKTLGNRLFQNENSRLFNRAHLERTHRFYEKHGGKTIILARFVPIVRTFAPFVAGMGTMNYRRFIGYSVFAAHFWVGICVFAGYFFGNLPFVKKNFSLVVLAIIAISVLPIFIEFFKHRLAQKKNPSPALEKGS